MFSVNTFSLFLFSKITLKFPTLDPLNNVSAMNSFKIYYVNRLYSHLKVQFFVIQVKYFINRMCFLGITFCQCTPVHRGFLSFETILYIFIMYEITKRNSDAKQVITTIKVKVKI